MTPQPRQRRKASELPFRTFTLDPDVATALVAKVHQHYDSLPNVGRHRVAAGDIDEVFFYKRTESELNMNLKLPDLEVRFEFQALGNGTSRLYLGALTKTETPPAIEQAIAAVEAGLGSPDYLAILLSESLP